MDMTQEFPVLVYGTLRPTGGNYEYFLDGSTYSEETVTLSGFTMYGNSGCPFLALGDRTITATLVYIDSYRYATVMKQLDSLESFRGEGDPSNGYERILHTFKHDGREVQAWIYVASERILPNIIRTTPVLESGDWIAHVNEERVSYAW